MVQAIVDISERTNRIINIIKARYDLKDKSEAIDKMAEEYEMEIAEPELRTEYIDKLEKIEKTAKFVDLNNFAREFGLE
ncbi:MAG: DUF2683 family protein [Candidatus Nanoarchaeia archaeon]|nr:DUF2683 family protein [Candidatus Nanoarchaeia archaeon]